MQGEIFRLSQLSEKTSAQTRYNSMLAGNTSYNPSNYESIETQVVGAGGASSVTFGSGGTIPQTYKHLQIRATLLSSTATANQAIQFNGDAGSNYVRHALYGNVGSNGVGTASTGNTSIRVSTFTGASSSNPSLMVIDIWDYRDTNKNKVVRSLAGTDQNSSGEVALLSGLWLNTNAITSITITGGGTLTQYSHFALYGIQGA